MAKQLDKVLVIDIESTCWDHYPPQGMIPEIIEVGLCLLDVTTLMVDGKRSILVKPGRSEIGTFCTELTSLTADMYETAKPLKNAIDILVNEYDSESRLMASWGDYDRRQFHRNCKDYGLRFPFGPTHLNVKNLFSISFGLRNELTLDVAMKHVGLPFEGNLHRGHDDAWNTAKLLGLLMKRARKGVS